MHGFKCKLSIKSNVLVLKTKIPPLASEVPRPPMVTRLGGCSEKIPLFIFYILLFFFSLDIQFWPCIRQNIVLDGSSPDLCGWFLAMNV